MRLLVSLVVLLPAVLAMPSCGSSDDDNALLFDAGGGSRPADGGGSRPGDGGVSRPPDASLSNSDDGDDSGRDLFMPKSLPTPAAPQPMTCEWLSGSNCWKQLVRDALACAPDAITRGVVTEDRKTCHYSDGARLRFPSPLPRTSDFDAGSTIIPITPARLDNADGSICAMFSILGLGRGAVTVGDKTALLENTSVTTYNVTCPDGSTFTNEGEGVCPSFGLYWLGGATPGNVVTCDRTTDVCSLELTGGDTGRVTLTTCDARDR
jgi:hypothetical protein